MDQLILLFVLLLSSLHMFAKALGLKIGVIKKLCGILFSGALAYGIHHLGSMLPNIRYILLGTALWFFAALMTKTKLKLALNTIVVSVATSQGVLMGSQFICFCVAEGLFPSLSYTIRAIIIVSIQFTVFYIVFQYTRFKNGFPSLKDKGSAAIGFSLSAMIILLVKLFNSDDVSYDMTVFILIGAGFGISGLVFLVREGIAKHRRQQINDHNLHLQETETAKVREELQVVETELQVVKEKNESLGKAVHTHSKMLMPIFMMARRAYSAEAANIEAWPEMQQVNAYMEEWAGELSRIRDGALPELHNGIIDSILLCSWMQAHKAGVRFDVRLQSDFSDWLAIPDVMLGQLLVELLDNAILGAAACGDKRVLVVFAYSRGFPTLAVLDTGPPFAPEILARLGKERVTNRPGGSGFGYERICGILREHKATFQLKERGKDGFTKTVLVRFDGKSGFTLPMVAESAEEVLVPAADLAI